MTTLQLSDIKEIVRNYGLIVNHFEPFGGETANSSYLLETDQESYILTVFLEKTFTNVTKMGQLLLLLGEYKFPSTRLIPLLTGEPALLYKEKPIILKRYISGQVCEDLNESMLYQIGEAMAKLHQIPDLDFLPNQHAYGLELFSSVINCNINREYESWLEEQLRYFEQKLPSELPRGPIHGDLFDENILFDDENLKAIIDFEDACYYYKLFDLGMAIIGLCVDSEKFTLSKVHSLIKGYQQIRTLEKQEQESLQLFIEYTATATSYWRFWKFHIHTPQAEKTDKHWEMVNFAKEARNMSKSQFIFEVFG
jgi:homoserine kinase type II